MAEFDPYRPPPDFAEINPYAAPEAKLEPVLPGRPRSIHSLPPFSMDAVVSRAWQMFQRELGTTIVVTLGVPAIIVVYELLGNAIVAGLTAGQAGQASVLGFTVAHALVRFVLQLWLTIGQTEALLKLARGEPTEFGDVFGGGRYLLRFIGATILCTLLFGTIALICAIPAMVAVSVAWSNWGPGPLAFAIFCGVAGVIGWIAIAVRFYQYPYVLVDRDCGVSDSLMISYELTRGHAFELAGLWIIAGLIAISGAFLCLVGMIFTLPLSMLIWSCAYALLAADKGLAGGDEPMRDLEFLD